MDTTAPRGGTVIMSDSYRLKPHGVPAWWLGHGVAFAHSRDPASGARHCRPASGTYQNVPTIDESAPGTQGAPSNPRSYLQWVTD
ncbi:jg21307 [Pararge aegeria aegeria]|uniref:Jg21307 protein n=1 Tax=Pararge aegeria aegeria TaxID=348720 RepID=A0A8S4R1D0_9NEOP|nr:jg21307 [Pararge aegeria aegeria]